VVEWVPPLRERVFEDYGCERESEFLKGVKERERRRLKLLKRLEEQ